MKVAPGRQGLAADRKRRSRKGDPQVWAYDVDLACGRDDGKANIIGGSSQGTLARLSDHMNQRPCRDEMFVPSNDELGL